MARPRLHPLDDLLDAAEHLATSGDPAGLTLRALATSAGASNGSIYHAFRSKEELLVRLWLRATARLRTIRDEAIQSAGGGDDAGHRAVVAMALSPAILAQRHPASAQLFFSWRRDQLFSADLAPDIVAELKTSQERFTGSLIGLAQRVWDRSDRIAVEAIAACVVDVPGGLISRRLREGGAVDAATQHRIEAAVRAILAVPLDPPRPRAPKKDAAPKTAASPR